MQLCGKVNDLLSDLGEAPETFTGTILFMSMFNDISCDKKDNEEECVANAKVVRSTTPMSRGKLKSKGHGQLSKHFAADQKNN